MHPAHFNTAAVALLHAQRNACCSSMVFTADLPVLCAPAEHSAIRRELGMEPSYDSSEWASDDESQRISQKPLCQPRPKRVCQVIDAPQQHRGRCACTVADPHASTVCTACLAQLLCKQSALRRFCFLCTHVFVALLTGARLHC